MLKYKVSTQDHNYCSKYRDPAHLIFGYVGPLGSGSVVTADAPRGEAAKDEAQARGRP